MHIYFHYDEIQEDNENTLVEISEIKERLYKVHKQLACMLIDCMNPKVGEEHDLWLSKLPHLRYHF